MKLKKYMNNLKNYTIRDWLNVVFIIVLIYIAAKLFMFLMCTLYLTWFLVAIKLNEMGKDHLLEPISKMIIWTGIYFVVGAVAWAGYTITKKKVKK